MRGVAFTASILGSQTATMHCKLALLLICLAICTPVLGQAPGSGTPDPHQSARDPELLAQIESLIRQLGDEHYAVREAATKSLQALGSRARALLEEATKSADLETAFRAKMVLNSLPKVTHTVVDALGSAIPLAMVTVTLIPRASPEVKEAPADPNSQIFTVQADEEGGVALPEIAAGPFAASARIEHPDYGRAQCDVNLLGNQKTLRVPLVRRGTEAHRRALVGQIVSPGGRPVAGAVIHCAEVRTPGEGLIQEESFRSDALTDDDGRFAFYLPNENRNRERGDLIPLNSRFHLTITFPGDDSLFPVAGSYANVQPVRIEMPRVTRFHRFQFEAAGGGWINDSKQLLNVRVQYEAIQGGERVLIALESKDIRDGRKLLPGKYIAEDFTGGKTAEYRPLVVTANSPEQLSFQLPHAVTYRGRAMHGVTGEPMASAFVIAYNSTSHNNLALLTADDWKLLRETPSNPPLDHPAIKRLGNFYGVQGLVRTDDDGRFAITREPDQEFYGIMAFAEDAIPFKVSVGSLKPDQAHQVDVGEFPLFPAARLLVRPVFAGERLSVMPQWLPEKVGQPDWFDRFEAASKDSNREFEYVHWLTINEQQPVYVPAGVRLRVRFESPYDDAWGPALVETVQLEAGSSKEAGDLHFTPSLPVVVLVVDPRGKPVEGIPVRRMYQGENAWCVAHNTDKDGRAQFYAYPNSQGQFRILDLPGPKEARDAANLGVEFKVSDQPLPEPFAITITDSQIDSLLKGKATPPPPP
jgi:hypothetical protein